MEAVLYSITSNKIGEKLNNFNFIKNDLILADRCYATTTGIKYCQEKEVQYIIRVRANSIRFCDKEGNVFDIRDKIIGLESGEQEVYVKTIS